MAQPIRTYSTEGFREKYMKPGDELDGMLKHDFGRFFITRVEDMLRLIRLPVPPVRSATHTIIFLTEGEAGMNIGSETHTIHKNECLVVPAGQIFSFSHPDENQGYIFNFHNDFITGKYARTELLQAFEFLNIWAQPKIQLTANAAEAENLLKRMLKQYEENGLQNTDLLQAYLIAFLFELNIASTAQSKEPKSRAAEISNRFKELVFHNFKTKQRVAEYADLLHISPAHLNRAVKETSGKSPAAFIDETLVLEAKVLLFQTALSVSEIAEDLGLTDASYFSRMFKKHQGCSPAAFRKMFQKS